ILVLTLSSFVGLTCISISKAVMLKPINSQFKFSPHRFLPISQKSKVGLIENYGAVIKSVTRIVRSELESPSILQNADFSPRTIKELIAQGEKKTLEELEYCETIQCKF
ncbi:MAG: hypothetical protein WAM27_12945, partial [Nitrososphaeraceae archaeon]